MWASFSHGFELKLSMRQAQSCSHPGPCDADVAALRLVPAIRRQLDKLAPDKVRAELRDHGAWDEAELADHEMNLSRILWIAACNIAEGE